MKALVYMVSFGKPLYAEMAQVCIASLRGKGRFEGDIAVATEGSFKPLASDNVRTLTVAAPRNQYEMFSAKTRYAPLLDVSGYERVLVLDTDVVAIDDLAPLLEFADGCASAAEEFPFHTMVNACMGDALNPDERERGADRFGVNAGIVCIDAKIFQAAMKRWAAATLLYRERANRYIDQPPLNAVFFRGEIPFRPLPRGWVEFPPLYPPNGIETRISPEAKLVHFCTGDKQEALTDMRGIDALLESIRSGVPDAVRLKNRDLFFLHQQINNWKAEAAAQAKIAAERQQWIGELEKARAFANDESERWQQAATELKGLYDRLRADSAELLAPSEEKALFWKTQSENWEKEAAFHKAQVARWEDEAAFRKAQSENWEKDSAYQKTQSENWEKEAAFHKLQHEQWKKEAEYQQQQARNWQARAEQEKPSAAKPTG